MAAVIVPCCMGDHGRDESDSRLVYDCDGRRFRIAELNLIARLDSLCMVGVTDVGGYDYTVREPRLDADSRSQIRPVGHCPRNDRLA